MSKNTKVSKFIMGKCNHLLLLLVLLAIPSLCGAQFEGLEEEMYGKYLTPVTSFGYISVTRYHTGLETREANVCDRCAEIDEELTDFLELRFKNNFADIPYEFVSLFEWGKNPKIGHLQCQIWLHGDSYPIAYHTECNLGAGKKSKVLHAERLGITSEEYANKHIKELLDQIISEFALTFFRARGEL